MSQTKPRARQKLVNPLVQGIERFLSQRVLQIEKAHAQLGEYVTVGGGLEREDGEGECALTIAHFPKRYTIYEPMLLLGPGFPTQTAAWASFYSTLDSHEKNVLFREIVAAFCEAGQRITHVALNAPIAPHLSNNAEHEENVMRSPMHLQPLYGDFGPDELLSSADGQPTQADFDAAFWVETSQLGGTKQVWAPRWTMFSRGNIREKARILGQAQQNPAPFPGFAVDDLAQELKEIDVVDFYVGIGYFAFPYLKRGFSRVFGWEINRWSVEGLRRGCAKNGMACEVVRIADQLTLESRSRAVSQVVDSLVQKVTRCIVLWGDNVHAVQVMNDISQALKSHGRSLNIRHCNLGLLPTSRDSWHGAVKVLDDDRGGWVHVHENTEIDHNKQKAQTVTEALGSLARREKGEDWRVECEHIEMVKTYAPGVGHFVFDIKLWPAR